MKNAHTYLRNKGFVEPSAELNGRPVIKAQHEVYKIIFSPETLTLKEARRLSNPNFNEVLGVEVWLNDSYAYMDEDIDSLLDNELGGAVAKKFGLEEIGGDKAQFLCAKVASSKQADNLVAAVLLYDKLAHSDDFKLLKKRAHNLKSTLSKTLDEGLAKIMAQT